MAETDRETNREPDRESDRETAPDTRAADQPRDEARAPGRPARVAARVWRALSPRVFRLSASIGAGLLLCLAFPPFGWWFLALPAAALLAWVLVSPATNRRGGFGYAFLFGLAFYLPLLPWISGLVGAAPWVGLAALEALFCGLFGLLAVVVRRLPGWPLWFAGAWMVAEWLKSVVPFGGFPWGAVAFSQADSPLLAVARVGGAPLVSFATVLVGFSLAGLLIEAVRWWRHEPHVARTTVPAVLVPGLCIVAVLLLIATAGPAVRRAGVGGDDPTVTVAAIQGNVPRLGLEFNAQRRAVLDNHVRETMRLAEDVRAGRAPAPAVVIWPENSSDIDPIANPDAGEQISAAADAIGAPILVGTVLRAPGYRPDAPVATNSVIVWDGATGPGERHDKKIVQPFGEYLPWRSFFRKLSSYADRAGYFIPGEGNGVVHAADVPIGVTTCWEVIFDRAARESVLGGAQLLAVPANNATFDAAMSAQQLAFARVRAVEHDRYAVVAGTTGISAIIAPDGREMAHTEFFEPAYLDMQIKLRSDLTPATRWGPLIEGVLVALGLAAVVIALLYEVDFARRRRRVASATGHTANDEGVA
ncbi:apolipoprotein N-acyltransferase [Mycolicibacterium grossiae]|uniref:apolipoprotein N-acyltransferase n=1 Tax=Mycolicibacterium grossiae TaxID=1552759 RepID=UPI0009F4A533|nr:apolipoprotein N-acyltransferase [Mycolicibacterium grossiae]QEM47018.1 apolipoprotein N-acyltransferase [Mycolicibacterium grossiae]